MSSRISHSRDDKDGRFVLVFDNLINPKIKEIEMRKNEVFFIFPPLFN